MVEASQKLAALMFTDIVGYSRLMGENEFSTVDLVQIYRDNLTRAIEENRGEVRDFIGDGLFASFECGLDAVRAGIQLQLFLHDFNRTDARRGQPALIARVGIHMGEVIELDGKLYGDDVNIAARLEPLAEPGALCVSQSVFDQLSGEEKVEIVRLGPQKLKNIKKVLECYQLLPEVVTLRQRARMAKRYLISQLRVRPKRTFTMAMVIFTFLAYFAVAQWQARQIPRGYYLEVADFTNAGENVGETDYFSEGITDAIRAQLAGIDKLYLVRSDERVGAPLKLEGNVLREEGRIRVIYRIMRREDGILVGGKTHDGVNENIFGLQDKLASSIAADLAAYYEFTDVQLAQTSFTSDITAYDYYMQGRGYLRMVNSGKTVNLAMESFKKALARDPIFSRAYAGLCGAFWQSYDISRDTNFVRKAEESCQKAVELDGKIAANHVALGEIYHGTARWDKAVLAYTRAISADGTSEEAYIGLGKVYQELKKYTEAEDVFRRAIKLKPGYWRGYNEMAAFLVSRGRLTEALSVYADALKITPENPTLMTNQGSAYFFLGEFAKAAELFNGAVKLIPLAPYYSNAGTMYYYAGNFEKAIEMFEAAMSLSKNDHRLIGNLADAYRQTLAHREKARALYDKAISLAFERLDVHPEDAETYEVLSGYYIHTGDNEKAKSTIQKALELEPENIEVLYKGAIVFQYLGDSVTAGSCLKRALKLGYSKKIVESDPDLTVLRKSGELSTILLGAF